MGHLFVRSGSLIAALLLAESVAVAQAPEPAPDANKGDAKELMQLGVKLLKSEDYLGALAVFKDAYQRFPSAKILLNIGTTQRLLNRNAEATNTYQRYLDSADADPVRVPEVTQEIQRLEKDLGRLEITAPAEAELQISDGDWIPAPVGKVYRVVPGAYVVRARRLGYKPFELKGEAAVGQAVTVAVVLEENPAPVGTPVFISTPPDEPSEAAQPRTRLAALAIAHIDIKGGAAMFVGGSFDVTDRVQVRAAGILGANFGGFVGGSFAVLTGSLRPTVSAGLPIFFNDGPRVGIRGAAGLEFVATRNFAVILELGVEYTLNPQEQVEFSGMLRSINSTAFIPALGVTARL